MRIRISRFPERLPAFLALAVLLLTTGGCISLEKRYYGSIFDSAIYRSKHQDGDLVPVTGPTVMASFSSCWKCGESDGNCSSKCGYQPGEQQVKYDVWVSHADQVLDFCSVFPEDKLILRMQQLQGLPPKLDQPDDSWKLLVVRVDGPEDLFRPCADPDPTTDGPCTEVFPCFWPDTTQCNAEQKAEMVAHRSWMAGQAFAAWQVPSGYPWTRLGYTFNWNRRAPSIVGTSEYVIPGAGPEIQVCGLVTAADFCRRTSVDDLCQ